ncbi:MAG: BCCT family transporter [Gammaproteobacteria bacterium]|nr:BCCT family transporter [Gammaproteobacteria bacterium]
MRVHRPVFFISASVILAFVIFGAVMPEQTKTVFSVVQDFIITRLGWFYTLSVTFFLGFVLWLLFSRFGELKLGKDDDEPEYSRYTWFAMLFSAGMGIGLLFYSVAEPILHYGSPPDANPETLAAAREAMRITFFHWGLHAWAIYIVIGLALAFFAFRYDLPLTIRSTLFPLLGKKIYGPIGNTVEILAVFGTLFGIATSLGLGIMQINRGLEFLGLMDSSVANQLWLIAGITLAATISVVTGLDGGIRRLSEINLGLGLLLVLFIFIAGPTTFLLMSFPQNLGNYLSSVVSMSFDTDAYQGQDWQKSWTMFYWGWWISWSPFVGMFIARVSRGRTIREFISGVLLVPTLLTFIWMVVFGNTAIHMELFGNGGILSAVNANVDTALFVMLERLPWASVTSTLAVIVIATYFVTSSDSGSLVIDILTSGGELNPPVGQRIFWALSEGAVAAVLLLTGGLVALQTVAITTALPFCAIMLFICWSLVRGLSSDYDDQHRTLMGGRK